jgi:hypothetical protein
MQLAQAEFLGRRWKTLDFEVMKGKERNKMAMSFDYRYIHKYHDNGDCDDSLVFYI